MGISIIVHFSGWFPPNIIALVLCTLLITQRLLVLILNNTLFIFSSGTRPVSQYIVTRSPMRFYVTKLDSSGSCLIAESLLLFTSDTCVLIPLVGKQINPPTKSDSLWVAFWTPVMIWEITRLSFYFLALIELAIRLFLLASNLMRTGSSIILFLVSFESASHSAS